MASNKIDVARASILMEGRRGGSVILLNERDGSVDQRERCLKDGRSPDAFIGAVGTFFSGTE